VISRWTRSAAVALAAAALAPSPALAAPRVVDPLAPVEREVALIEERLASVERYGIPAEDPPGLRAQRRYDEGERQYQLGDWLNAAVLLTDAVDEPAWGSAADRTPALFLLADALRREGLCGAARVRYRDYLALGDTAHRGDAVSGALACAVKERRHADIDQLLVEAARAFGAEPPPEVRYLAAKAAFQRTDLPAAERISRASAAFERVGPPYQLQAWYFLGVLRIEEQNLHGSLQWFEGCARAEASGERDQELRELCVLALGRVHAQMGDAPAAIGWYTAVPWESPRFGDAIHEMALAYVGAKQFERALEMTSFIPELAPESPLAPEATVLRGHLLLRLGRFAEATEAYNVVINTYAPVRDEIDAILSMQEDPVRYFNELIGRQGKTFDVANVLPPVAVKWATTNNEVAGALGLVKAIDGARRDVKDARDLADRLDALLQRGGGLDAFPALQRGYAHAQAVENAASRAEGAYVAAASTVADAALVGERRAELARARDARKALEARVDVMPRTPEQVEERLTRMRGRIDDVDRAAFQLRYQIDSCTAAISGSETWIDGHRAELGGDAEGRRELTEELRKHRAIVEGYEGELAAMRQELAKVRDATGGVDAMVEESRVRAEYLEALERERAVADAARETASAADPTLFDRVDRAHVRLGVIRSRARALKLGIAADALRRAEELRARVGEEKIALAAHTGTLEGVQAVSKDLLGVIAVRSIADVRRQFYRIVLKADVGIVDVAWSRKRQRLEKIQTLAVQKGTEVDQLDRDYRAMLREIE